jgi:deoxyribose-phosphate aldolase
MTLLNERSFASLVDHTLLKPEATEQQIVALCSEARRLQTASVCVNGLWAARVHQELDGCDVRTCCVVGFPLGAMEIAAVGAEAARATDQGAIEIDMVIPVGLIKSGADRAAGGYIAGVRQSVPEVVLKVILESALLTDDEIVRACQIAVASGANFVKTSTGFNPAGGATGHAVELMRRTVGDSIGVKASGGIRDLSDVERMLSAGANRLGMSATAAVVEELVRR